MNKEAKDLLNLGNDGQGQGQGDDGQGKGGQGNDGQGQGDDGQGKGGQGNDGQGKENKTFNADWKEYIPEELKGRAEWNNIKDPADLFKNYINAQQMISKSVRIPDDNASPEDIANFYAKLGKPKSKDEYDFEYNPAKENYIYNKESFDFTMFKDIADKANLTKDQYQALASAYIDLNNENYLNYNQALEKKAAEELQLAEQRLKQAWGNDYIQNINSISDKINNLYDKDTIKKMQDAGLLRDDKFLEAQLKLTKMMTGDTVFIEGNVVENVPQTLSSLQDKRDKLMAEDYVKNREKVQALNKQIVQLKQAQQSGVSRFEG